MENFGVQTQPAGRGRSSTSRRRAKESYTRRKLGAAKSWSRAVATCDDILTDPPTPRTRRIAKAGAAAAAGRKKRQKPPAPETLGSLAETEAVLLKWVMMRETCIQRLGSIEDVDVESDDHVEMVLELLASLRILSLEVLCSVRSWKDLKLEEQCTMLQLQLGRLCVGCTGTAVVRDRAKEPTYYWQGVNYVEKMMTDTDYLRQWSGLAELVNVNFKLNPLLLHSKAGVVRTAGTGTPDAPPLVLGGEGCGGGGGGRRLRLPAIPSAKLRKALLVLLTEFERSFALGGPARTPPPPVALSRQSSHGPPSLRAQRHGAFLIWRSLYVGPLVRAWRRKARRRRSLQSIVQRLKKRAGFRAWHVFVDESRAHSRRTGSLDTDRRPCLGTLACGALERRGTGPPTFRTRPIYRKVALRGCRRCAAVTAVRRRRARERLMTEAGPAPIGCGAAAGDPALPPGAARDAAWPCASGRVRGARDIQELPDGSGVLLRALRAWSRATGVAAVHKPADKPVDEPADTPVDEPADKPADEPANKPVDEPGSRRRIQQAAVPPSGVTRTPRRSTAAGGERQPCTAEAPRRPYGAEEAAATARIQKWYRRALWSSVRTGRSYRRPLPFDEWRALCGWGEGGGRHEDGR